MHYETTGVELYNQCKPTHFVAGTGTSGTFMGVSKRLKEFDASIKIALMQPDSPFHGLEGMKHMESTITPKIFDKSIADLHITVKTEDAYKTSRRLAAEEGVFVGISSGANVFAAMESTGTSPVKLVCRITCAKAWSCSALGWSPNIPTAHSTPSALPATDSQNDL